MAEPNIVLKDQTGNSGTYEGIDMIKIPGHNADGIVEEILFKKYVEGASDGKIKMTAGRFMSPIVNEVIDETISTSNGFTINNNVWSKTIDAVEDGVLVAGRLYVTTYMGFLQGEAVARSNFSKYGNCITFGNPAIATHNHTDEKSGEILIIYQPSSKKTTILATVSAGKVDAYGSTSQIESNIDLYDMSTCEHSYRINHGGTTKPDAVFVMHPHFTWTSVPGMFDAYWGFKSSFAHLIPGDATSGCIGGLGHYSEEESLDNAPTNSFFLHCEDEETFSTPHLPWIFSPNGGYVYWFAFWGLTDETT